MKTSCTLFFSGKLKVENEYQSIISNYFHRARQKNSSFYVMAGFGNPISTGSQVSSPHNRLFYFNRCIDPFDPHSQERNKIGIMEVLTVNYIEVTVVIKITNPGCGKNIFK